MPFEKVQAERLALSVVRQIELLILRGVLRPGVRLPSERELAERMGVSRPSLRDGIAMLHEQGLLEMRPGSGVYVVDDLQSQFPEALSSLFARHGEAVRDLIAFRRDMEGLAVERAARFGSDIDLQRIDQVFAAMEAAHERDDAEEEARLDAEFHLAVVEACNNSVMIHVMRSLYGLLQRGVFFNRQVMFRQRMTRDMLLDQHRAINVALQGRDAKEARAAVDRHLGFIEKAVEGQRRADHNDLVARQRREEEDRKRA